MITPKYVLTGNTRLAPLSFAALLCLAGMGCGGGQSPSVTSSMAGLKCIDDSSRCIGLRQSTLQHLMRSPDRGWMRRAPDADAYASGVRLFAFKRQKASLSCPELKFALNEAQRGPAVLDRAGGRLSPAQLSRGKLLAGEVARELRREQRRRCRG